MKWSLVKTDPLKMKVETLVVGVFKGAKGVDGLKAQAFGAMARQMRFEGKEGESFYAFDTVGSPAKQLLVVGLGSAGDATRSTYRDAGMVAAKGLRDRFIKRAAFSFPLPADDEDLNAAVEGLVEGVSLNSRRFQKYLTDKDRIFTGLQSAAVFVKNPTAKMRRSVKLGETLAEATAYARDFVSEPSNVLTPEQMAREARKLSKETGIPVKIYGRKECEKMGMGAYLAVAQGSRNEPRFIHFSYRPKGAKARLGIVGKGLTFDSGGISLKPGEGMGAMKADMGGSGAVMGIVKALGALKPNVAVEAVMAMAENMPGGNAYRPGDIIRSMSGKTIEVLNTDAEGRLTLADALTYVQKQKVDAVIDMATLTGACVVALGPDYTGAMGNDQAMMDAFLETAEESGDKVWQLPLPLEYRKFIKTPVADVANLSRVRWGGALTAGLFLREFIEKKTLWIHLDIAGPAYRDEDGLGAGKGEGSGAGVRALMRYLLAMAGS